MIFKFLSILLCVIQALNCQIPLTIDHVISKIHNHKILQFNDLPNLADLVQLNSFKYDSSKTSTNISNECSDKLEYLLQGLKNKSFWAWQGIICLK